MNSEKQRRIISNKHRNGGDDSYDIDNNDDDSMK